MRGVGSRTGSWSGSTEWGWIVGALAVLLAPLPAAADQVDDPIPTYEAGVEFLDRGAWAQALEVWEAASERLSGEGVHDPRIGIAFMETAVEHEAVDQYDTASDLYLWGLGSPSLPEGGSALDEELDRLRLLWGIEEAARFDSLASSGSEGVRLALRRYWIERDPTPATSENERLIEHWERIRDARRRFVYNRSTPIGTDDRGIVYLKFGEPDRIDRGSLGASELEMRVRIPRDLEARQRLRRYDRNPQYEVWVYEGLNPEGFSFFLFGNVGGSGPFELVETVTDLIPDEAKSRNSARNTPGGIPAGFFLELFYYQDLSVVGGHFGRRFAELSQRWDEATYRRQGYNSAARSTPGESELESLRFRYEQEDRYMPPTPPLVPLTSEFEGNARDEMVAQMMRTLSDDGVPLLVLVGTSAPRLIATAEDAYAGELDFPEWVMRHTLIIRDQEMDEVGRLVQPLSAERADVSSFVIRHVPTPLHLTMTARTLRISEDQQDTLIAGDRLPGQRHFVPGEPLVTDSATFAVSDLLTGMPIPPTVRADALPYPLLPSENIWRRDPLRVYLEMFNPGEIENGRAQLDVRFVVVPLQEDRSVDFEREPVTLAVTLSPPAGASYRESFDMQLRDQELGFYRVDVEIRDVARGQTITRSRIFELVR